ncbi:unnamed protein product [Blumeria hordei]|uniref:threonine--tRNA ligase n=1 Tax=Blumeria hordei TaxID=2867405 RepID=A0A383UQ17_BLUHO|nr:unnamed protein product [Blumeria hordei]
MRSFCTICTASVQVPYKKGLYRNIGKLTPLRQNLSSARVSELKALTTKIDETQKNLSTLSPDHRELGIQQELFTTSKFCPGTPIFLPNGTKIFNKLIEYLRCQYEVFGFQEVLTPTIFKKSLWETSGHWDNYAEDMYAVTGRRTLRVQDGETEVQDEPYGLKPMNCPCHCLIFASKGRSYRDLPLRYADFSSLHRNEVAGALSGLTRVKRFHQDDGHIFCRPSQIKGEIRRTLDFVKLTYEVLGLGPYRLVLSTRPSSGFIGTEEEWDNAELALKESLDASGLVWKVNEGDGAFYGPKIDIILQSSADKKEHQTATIQLDFQLPKRFGLRYQAPAPEVEKKGLVCTDSSLLSVEGPVTPVLIHRAVLGSVERIMALLIEHYNGHWPFWLNPNQAAIITVNDSPEILEYAGEVGRALQGLGKIDSDQASRQSERGIPRDLASISVEVFDKPIGVNHKIAAAKRQRYGIIVLIGPKEVQSGTISVDLSGIPIRNRYTDKILQMASTKANQYIPGQDMKWEVLEYKSDSTSSLNDYSQPSVSPRLRDRLSVTTTFLRSIMLELLKTYS